MRWELTPKTKRTWPFANLAWCKSWYLKAKYNIYSVSTRWNSANRNRISSENSQRSNANSTENRPNELSHVQIWLGNMNVKQEENHQEELYCGWHVKKPNYLVRDSAHFLRSDTQVEQQAANKQDEYLSTPHIAEASANLNWRWLSFILPSPHPTPVRTSVVFLGSPSTSGRDLKFLIKREMFVQGNQNSCPTLLYKSVFRWQVRAPQVFSPLRKTRTFPSRSSTLNLSHPTTWLTMGKEIKLRGSIIYEYKYELLPSVAHSFSVNRDH